MKLPLILNSVLWLATAGTSPVANQQTISIDLTPDVGEDKMSAYFDQDIGMLFKNEESSNFLDFSELAQSFYSYFIESISSKEKKLKMGSPVKDLNSDLSH